MSLTVVPRSCCGAERVLECGVQPIHSTSGQFPPAFVSTSELEMIMRSIALVIAFVISLTAPASAQRAEIEAINAKWIEMFNKGDFSGIGSLYSTDATAFPP